MVVTEAVVAGNEAPLLLTEPLEDWLEAQQEEAAGTGTVPQSMAAVG